MDTSAVDNDTENDEANDSQYLYQAEYEFNWSNQLLFQRLSTKQVLLLLRTFAVSADSKKVDYTEEEEEDGNPNTNVDIVSPEGNGDTGSGDFEWQYRKPSDRIVPTHSKAPVLYIIILLLIILRCC